MPPQGGVIINSSLLSEIVSRISFAQIENGKLSGFVLLFTKSNR